LQKTARLGIDQRQTTTPVKGVLAVIMVMDSAAELKRFLSHLPLRSLAMAMALRVTTTFIYHRGRMSCSQAAVAIESEPLCRSQVTRFLARPRWKREDVNAPARKRLLMLERRRGPFLLVIDATLVGQVGKTTENTYSTGDRSRGKRKSNKKGKRYHKYRHARRSCHSFTMGVLITPSGYRIPYQIPHYTPEYCQTHGLIHLSTAEAAAKMIQQVELPDHAEVYVLGDTAYDAAVVQQACAQRHWIWIVPANAERVLAGPSGQRPKVRSRLNDWSRLSLTTIRIHASQSEFAEHRRLSRWRVGPKLKPRTYYVHQETAEVKSVGRVTLVFSTVKKDLQRATADDVKILMTNALHLSARTIVDLYACRWQIELFFKEIKSRLGFDQYRFRRFEAVMGWVELALTTVLFLETTRAEKLHSRTLSKKEKEWWRHQRLHGLAEAMIQQIERNELKYISERIKTKGGIAKLQRLLLNGSPKEYRNAG
jgi:hypothetical protein